MEEGKLGGHRVGGRYNDMRIARGANRLVILIWTIVASALLGFYLTSPPVGSAPASEFISTGD